MRGNGNGFSGFHLSWQNLITSVGLVLLMVSGFWTLAYIPISNSINELKQQVNDLRQSDQQHFHTDDAKYLTQKEHGEFKSNIQTNVDRLARDTADIRKEVEARRAEAATRQDVTNALNTTRVEFLSEIKRIDQITASNMSRQEFEAWKSERDKTIYGIMDRQNRFSEALDAMYQRITTIPSRQ